MYLSNLCVSFGCRDPLCRFQFEPKFLQNVSAKICNEVKNVNRVVYDITSKPPSTVEWE